MNTRNITSQTSQVGGIKINERANISDVGYFEQDGKYYILGALYYSPNRRNLASSDGSHNGILWYPLSGTKEVAKQTVITSERAGDVLKNSSASD